MISESLFYKEVIFDLKGTKLRRIFWSTSAARACISVMAVLLAETPHVDPGSSAGEQADRL